MYGWDGGSLRCKTANEIDLTDYKTLYVDVDVISVLSNQYGFNLIVEGAREYDLSVTTVRRNIYSVDISSVSVKSAFTILVQWASSCRASVYGIWLEK